jgi:hypothetical protein
MSDNFTITIDMDKKCAECGRGGAVPSGICLKCTGKAISGKPMKSAQGRAVYKRFIEHKPRKE